MVIVCVKCGSGNLGTPPSGFGYIPGRNESAGIYHCNECGWDGFPIDVKNADEYRKHLKRFDSGR